MSEPIVLDVHRSVTAMAWSPDGALLAFGDEAGRVFFLDPASGQLLKSVLAHGMRVSALSWSPVTGLLLSAGRDGRVRVWDGKTLEPIAECHSGAPWADWMAWSPDGQWFATAADRQLRIWDARCRLMNRDEQHASPIRAIAWHPRSLCVAAASAGVVRLVPVVLPSELGKRPVGELGVTRRSFISVAWSPDGSAIASGTQGEETHIWLWPEGKPWNAEPAHAELKVMSFTQPVTAILFHPAQPWVLTAAGPQVRLWPVPLGAGATPEPLSQWSHGAKVMGCSWGAEERSVWTLALGGVVSQWLVPPGGQGDALLRQFGSPLPDALHLLPAANGKFLALANDHGNVLVWPTAMPLPTAAFR